MYNLFPQFWLRKPKPSDWGCNMTIGIVGICDYWQSLIFASDQMISAQDFSGDSIAIKIGSIHPHWGMLYSADDIGCISDIYSDVRSNLDRGTVQTLQQVMQTVIGEYRRELTAKKNAFLSRFDLDLASFKREGRSIFGDAIFSDYCGQLERMSLGCDFLVGGFDDQKLPHVFVVGNPGEKNSYDSIGFWAIGTGANSALSNLFFHSFRVSLTLPRAVYHICESKFMAESAMGVGKATSVVVLTKVEGRIATADLSDDFIKEIRNWWEIEGRPRITPTIEKAVADGLADPEKFRRVVF